MTRRAYLLIEIALIVLAGLTVGTMVWVARGDTRPAASAPVVTPIRPAVAGGIPHPALGADRVFAEGPGPAATAAALMTRVAPTLTPAPTSAATRTPALAAASAPPTLAPPQFVAVNGVPFETIVVMPPDVVARVHEIFAAGRALGRNPRAYAKVGDSTTENPHFLARFDEGPYNLGAYGHLQPVVDQFAGSHGRDSIAVRIGLHSWSANDPAWAEPGLCLPNETPVACEIRVHNPSILFIRLGTNDVGVGGMFDANIRQMVDTAIAAGVVPIIGTKGDRHEGSNENNDALRRIAADYRIPLWDFDRVAGTLPGRGLDVDAAHMNTYFAHDYNDPTAFTRGHAMHNLTALMALDAVWRLAGGE